MNLNLGSAFVFLVMLGGGLVAFIWFLFAYFSSHEIKTTKRLEPTRVEVVTTDKKTDTLFVYKLP